MTLNIDDVLEVLQIVRETKDTELHIDTGEMKLSISRGTVSGTGSGFIEQGTVAQAPAAQIEAAAPAAVIAAPVAKQQADPQAGTHFHHAGYFQIEIPPAATAYARTLETQHQSRRHLLRAGQA